MALVDSSDLSRDELPPFELLLRRLLRHPQQPAIVVLTTTSAAQNETADARCRGSRRRRQTELPLLLAQQKARQAVTRAVRRLAHLYDLPHVSLCPAILRAHGAAANHDGNRATSSARIGSTAALF